MSLVDTVMHELNNWQYKGYKLKDAQIFKIEMDVWTEKDERKWSNEMEKIKAHLSKLRTEAEINPTIKKEDRSILRVSSERWHSAEEGSFSFPKSKPPYSNIIISLRAGERNRVLWLLDNFCTEEDCKKEFNHYSLTQLFPILDFSNPSSWWGVGKTYEELTHPTTSANVCMHFWQKLEGGKIPLNMMGPFDLTDHCSSIPQWARFLYAQNIYTVMKVCSIINCSNIALDKHEVPDKVNRKRKRKNKKTLSPYYTLKIKPKSSYKKKSKKSEEESKPRRLHLVRGHFKHYTESAPLFGKYTGLYWWQPHVRGE